MSDQILCSCSYPKESQYPPLELVTRPAVDTASAAFYLNRKQQTLRAWATYQNGPVNPIRVGGRLAWKTSDLRRVLMVE